MNYAGLVSTSLAVGLLAGACGSVAESDPQFWEKTADLGGKSFDFGAATAATGGTPGAGGDGVGPPPVNGGAPSAGGVSSVAGAGGELPGMGGAIGSGGVIGAGGAGLTGGAASTGGASGSGGAVVVAPTGPCKFTFSVTTVTARGRYAPRNVGAMWISDAQGKMVKALEVWGLRRLSNATAWTQASAGAKVDVVTSATRAGHGPLTADWDCLDPSKNRVPGGAYQAHVTFAESDAFPFFGPPPIQAVVDFQLGAAPLQVDGADTANFTGMHVAVE